MVFAIDGRTNSIGAVSSSPILKPGVVTYVEEVLHNKLYHLFPAKLQLALLDGPHAYPFPELEYDYIYPQLERRWCRSTP